MRIDGGRGGAGGEEGTERGEDKRHMFLCFFVPAGPFRWWCGKVSLGLHETECEGGFLRVSRHDGRTHRRARCTSHFREWDPDKRMIFLD